jgi:hypothetical protein
MQETVKSYSSKGIRKRAVIPNALDILRIQATVTSLRRLFASGPGRERNRDLTPSIRHNPIDSIQASLLIKLEKLDWSSILDNKSDGHAR